MKELTITNLRKTYGTKTLFDGIELAVRTGDRIGLIGPNGTGKSSLLNVIAGFTTYDEGEITKPNQYEIAMLDQNPQLNPADTILDAVYDSKAPLIQLLKRYERKRLELEADPNNERLQDTFSRLGEEMTLKGGWEIEISAKSILSQLGLDDLSLRIGDCSGGQQKRIGIAQVLIAEPDLLILDEPTNHLDIEAIEWLEDYLRDYQGALLIISHDRFFLDRIVNKVLELEMGKLTVFKGNYSRYLLLQAEAKEAVTNAYLKQQREIKKTEAYIDRYRAGIKSKQARGRQSILNRLERIEAPQDSKKLGQFHFTPLSRSGDRVLDVLGLEQDFGEKKVLTGVSFTITRGQKIGLVGANGTGKSTILKIIAGQMVARKGDFSLGSQVKLAYFDQEYANLSPDNEVVQEITGSFPLSQEEARKFLGKFLFSGDDAFKKVKQLSGGEKGRISLLKILLSQPNFLLLDEPTNHLDIPSKEAIEQALQSYPGTILVVSHDRYFLDQVVTGILELQDGKVKSYLGNYSEYKQFKDNLAKQQAAAIMENKKEKTPKEQPIKKKNQKLLGSLEIEISEIEDEKEKLKLEFTLPEVYTDGLKTKAILEKIKELEDQLAVKYRAWEELVD